MEFKNYIYIYLDPRKPGLYKYSSYKFDYEPFYVGKGKGRRFLQLSNGRSFHFKNKINKIKIYGLNPIVIKLKENLSEEKSFILEYELINIIGRNDINKGPLINFTNGGEGTSGWIPSEETKKLMSEKKKGKYSGKNSPHYGKHHSEETKRKQSEKKIGKYLGKNNPNYGKHCSEEWKKEHSEKMRGKFKGDKNPSSILTEKNVIEIWKYLNEGILTQIEIGKKFGVNNTTISKINVGKNWHYLYIKYKEGDK